MSYINLSAEANEVPRRRVQRILTDASAEPWIILDSLEPGNTITAGVVIVTGEGTIYYTVEDKASIINGTAEAVEWSKGSQTSTSYGYFPSGVTGIKFAWTSGTVKGIIAV